MTSKADRYEDLLLTGDSVARKEYDDLMKSMEVPSEPIMTLEDLRHAWFTYKRLRRSEVYYERHMQLTSREDYRSQYMGRGIAYRVGAEKWEVALDKFFARPKPRKR